MVRGRMLPGGVPAPNGHLRHPQPPPTPTSRHPTSTSTSTYLLVAVGYPTVRCPLDLVTVGLNCFSRGALNGAEQREDGTLESQFGPDSRPELPPKLIVTSWSI